MRQTIVKAAIGMLGSFTWTVSGFETALRITGSVIGILIGAFTLLTVIDKWRRERKPRRPHGK